MSCSDKNGCVAHRQGRGFFGGSGIASAGFLQVQSAFAIIYGVLIMIAGKKLRNKSRGGYKLTLVLSVFTFLLLPLIGPLMEGIVSFFFMITLFSFIITDLYLLKNRKLFSEKKEKKDDKHD